MKNTRWFEIAVFLGLWMMHDVPLVRAQESQSAADGRRLFRDYCAVCHTVGEPWRKVGPPLKGLFQRKQFVTGRPVDEESLRHLILEGGPNRMPGFQHTLSPQQVQELIRFLKTV